MQRLQEVFDSENEGDAWLPRATTSQDRSPQTETVYSSRFKTSYLQVSDLSITVFLAGALSLIETPLVSLMHPRLIIMGSSFSSVLSWFSLYTWHSYLSRRSPPPAAQTIEHLGPSGSFQEPPTCVNSVPVVSIVQYAVYGPINSQL